MVHYDVDSMGVVDGSIEYFVFHTMGPKETTIHIGVVLQRLHPENKGRIYYCGYASIPKEYHIAIGEQEREKEGVTFTTVGITPPSFHLGQRYADMHGLVDFHHWVGWDWMGVGSWQPQLTEAVGEVVERTQRLIIDEQSKHITKPTLAPDLGGK